MRRKNGHIDNYYWNFHSLYGKRLFYGKYFICFFSFIGLNGIYSTGTNDDDTRYVGDSN